jgi:hypothetical protein
MVQQEIPICHARPGGVWGCAPDPPVRSELFGNRSVPHRRMSAARECSGDFTPGKNFERGRQEPLGRLHGKNELNKDRRNGAMIVRGSAVSCYASARTSVMAFAARNGQKPVCLPCRLLRVPLGPLERAMSTSWCCVQRSWPRSGILFL